MWLRATIQPDQTGVIVMDYPDDLRSAETALQQAENEFLSGTEGMCEALLEKLSTGPFGSDTTTARERMQNLDESRYIKWDRWTKTYNFAASFWKDEGYPSIDATTHQPSNPDWYSRRTGTTAFVKDLVTHRFVAAPTINGEQKGPPTPIGEPSNRWLLDFVAFSSLRLSFKHHWEKLVRDIVRKRSQTNLALVAERLCLNIQDVLSIARKVMDLDDHVIEHDVSDSSKNLTYLCRKPDSSIIPLVDITS